MLIFRPLARSISILSGGPLSGSSVSGFRPNLRRPVLASNLEPSFGGVFSGITATQRRFKARGHTFQPSTLRRKRKFGFLARLRNRGGKKILARRREKGRWYLSH